MDGSLRRTDGSLGRIGSLKKKQWLFHRKAAAHRTLSGSPELETGLSQPQEFDKNYPSSIKRR
jgi:hypothetical protein